MLTLAVHTLTYQIQDRNGVTKNLLDNVQLLCRPGTLTAIMGPSGSGKTTLLNTIAGRTKAPLRSETSAIEKEHSHHYSGHTVHGMITINGNAVTGAQVQSYSKYVMQRDELLSFLTVEESIKLGAYLRLKGESKASILTIVEKVISDLGLGGCRDVLIGDEETKGVSGGQKKRVSIALELLTNPSLLFLDEPTSGLDSSLAFDVVKVLSRLARQNKTVVATIHQPRPQILQMFDQILVLSKGQAVYHGPTTELGAYLLSIGHPCPKSFSVSDYFLDLLTPEADKSELMEDLLVKPPSRVGSKVFSAQIFIPSTSHFPPSATLLVPSDDQTILVGQGRAAITCQELEILPGKYAMSPWAAKVQSSFDLIQAEGASLLPTATSFSFKTALEAYMLSVYVLIYRNFKEKLRKPSTFVVQFITTAWMGLFCGFIWYRSLKPSSTDLDCAKYNALMGALGWTILEVSWNIFSMVVSFPDSKPLFNREVANKMYDSSAFYLAKNLSDLPFILCTSCIHVIGAYWLVDYGNRSRLTLYFFVAAFLNSFTAIAFMIMVAAFAPSSTISTVITSTAMIAMSLNFGYFMSVDALPRFWAGLRYINWMYYSFNGIQMMIFQDSPEIIELCANFDTRFTPGALLGWTILLGFAYRVVGYFALQFTNRRVGLES